MKIAFSVVLIVFLLFNITAYAEEVGDQFFEAKKVSLNNYVQGDFPREYDTDTYEFIAQEAGYYAIRGKADRQIRGHLYDQNYNFLYGGTRLSSDNTFFISTYLERGQKIYFKVDSLVRQYQNYSVIVEKDRVPFNKIVLGSTSYTTYLEPNTVKTITIPVYFYLNSKRVYNVEPTYPFMMTINSVGLLRGQAAYNLKTNELEVDLYDENNATITLNIGREISARCFIKSIHSSGTVSDSMGNGQENEQDQEQEQEETPSEEDSEDDFYRKPEVHKGDVDLNNIVNMNDVVALLDPLTLSKFNQEQFNIADVTNNGIVDASDALMILRRVSGARK